MPSNAARMATAAGSATADSVQIRTSSIVKRTVKAVLVVWLAVSNRIFSHQEFQASRQLQIRIGVCRISAAVGLAWADTTRKDARASSGNA